MTFPIAPFAVQTKLSISLVVDISSNQQELNLRNYLLNLGWNGRRPVEVRINPNVYVWSNNTANAALNMGGDYPGGLTIVNNGFILGRGGVGGTAISPTGGAGGPAINLTGPVTIKNANGFIRGGGGGGGFGGTGGQGSVTSTVNNLQYSPPAYAVGFIETGTDQTWIWNGVTVAITPILQASVVAGGFTYNLGALRARALIGTNPQTGPYRRIYEIIRVETGTTLTSGGVGGTGGNGTSFNQSLSAGGAGTAGGTNAGAGGSGGSGGDWGSNGVSGSVGANGNSSNGSSGSSGGAGGKAVNANGFNVTFATGGDRISGAIG